MAARTGHETVTLRDAEDGLFGAYAYAMRQFEMHAEYGDGAESPVASAHLADAALAVDAIIALRNLKGSDSAALADLNDDLAAIHSRILTSVSGD